MAGGLAAASALAGDAGLVAGAICLSGALTSALPSAAGVAAASGVAINSIACCARTGWATSSFFLRTGFLTGLATGLAGLTGTGAVSPAGGAISMRRVTRAGTREGAGSSSGPNRPGAVLSTQVWAASTNIARPANTRQRGAAGFGAERLAAGLPLRHWPGAGSKKTGETVIKPSFSLQLHGVREAEIANIPFVAALPGALQRCSSLVWLATRRSERLALHPASAPKNSTLAISASPTDSGT